MLTSTTRLGCSDNTDYSTLLGSKLYTRGGVVGWWWCGGGVVWLFLSIIEPPQSRRFNSGLNWVVAIKGVDKKNFLFIFQDKNKQS